MQPLGNSATLPQKMKWNHPLVSVYTQRTDSRDLKRYFCARVQSSVTHSGQTVEPRKCPSMVMYAQRAPSTRWTVVHGGNPDACRSADGP